MRGLDDEVPAGNEVGGGISKALHLLVLRQEVDEGVPHRIDEGELSFHTDGGHVTIVTGTSTPPGLSRNAATMSGDRSTP